jgi:hypothetical protein
MRLSTRLLLLGIGTILIFVGLLGMIRRLNHRVDELEGRTARLERAEHITRVVACRAADYAGYDGPPIRCGR